MLRFLSSEEPNLPSDAECGSLHRTELEKLEALKRDFLPKSLALHISLAQKRSQKEKDNSASAAGLGLGAMMLGASTTGHAKKSSSKHQQQQPASRPGEVVINVRSVDASNNSGCSALSETDR